VKKLSKKDKQGIVDSCPNKVMILKEHDGSIEVIDEGACTFCQECLSFCERTLKKPGMVNVNALHDKFLFELESTGSLKPENIVK